MAGKLQTSVSMLQDVSMSEGAGLWKLLGQASVFKLGRLGLRQKVTHPGHTRCPAPAQLLLCCSLPPPRSP